MSEHVIGECPCMECIRLDWEAWDDSRPSLAEFIRLYYSEESWTA